jgi:tetratricopeptide (TPR) repeat protein
VKEKVKMKRPDQNRNTGTSDNPEEIRTQISTLLSQNQLAIAAEYARSGDFSSAEDILTSIPDDTLKHSVLELRAKIKAQQGDYESAKSIWAEALKDNPSCPDCLAGLQRVRSILSSKLPAYWIKPAVFFVAILAGLGLVVALFLRINQLENIIPEQIERPFVPTVVFQSDQIENEISALGSPQDKIIDILEEDQEKIGSLSTQIALMNQTPTPSPDPTQVPSIIDQIVINTENLNYSVKDETIEITFEIGLFLYNWLLSEEDKTTLLSHYTELEQWDDEIIIKVIGFTDDTEKEIQ